MTRRWAGVTRCVGVSVCALALAFAPAARHLAVAFAVLAKVTGAPLSAAWERRLLHPIHVAQWTLHISTGQVRSRRYTPLGAAAQVAPPVLLVPGVHAKGIDEPRLIALARALAQGGLDVLTAELPPLTHYTIDASLVTDIRELARAWADETHNRAVGVIGISFAGGLALMAAAQQGGTQPIGFVASVGAHQDLMRVCEFYAGHDVRGPDNEVVRVAPHPYGSRVMLRTYLSHLVSARDLPLAKQALDTYLHDRPHAARRVAARLSASGREVMDVLLDTGGSGTLSRWLLDSCRTERPQLEAASPRGHLAGLQVPVLLLHGSADPVIPSIETLYLAREVPPGALRVVLISELLRHAEFPAPPAPSQAYRLARFMQRLLGVAGAMEAANVRERKASSKSRAAIGGH